MKIHHRGYACHDIAEAIEELKKIHRIRSATEIIFDELQDAFLCLLEIEDDNKIELVSGNAVKNYLEQGISLYHVCYEVDDLQAELKKLIEVGHTIVSKPKPARLFNNRLVAFVQTNLGLIELLEKNITETIRKHNQSINIVVNATFSLGSFSSLFNHLSKKTNEFFKLIEGYYYQIFPALLDKNSKINKNEQGFNVVFTRFDDWKYTYDKHITLYTQLENYADEFIKYIQSSSAISTSHFLIFLCPSNPGLFSKEEQKYINVIEEKISGALSSFKNITLIKEKEVLSYFSPDNFYDKEADRLGSLPFTEEAEAALALLTYRKIFSIIHKLYC